LITNQRSLQHYHNVHTTEVNLKSLCRLLCYQISPSTYILMRKYPHSFYDFSKHSRSLKETYSYPQKNELTMNNWLRDLFQYLSKPFHRASLLLEQVYTKILLLHQYFRKGISRQQYTKKNNFFLDLFFFNRIARPHSLGFNLVLANKLLFSF
jgi:hypothetical protein